MQVVYIAAVVFSIWCIFLKLTCKDNFHLESKSTSYVYLFIHLTSTLEVYLNINSKQLNPELVCIFMYKWIVIQVKYECTLPCIVGTCCSWCLCLFNGTHFWYCVVDNINVYSHAVPTFTHWCRFYLHGEGHKNIVPTYAKCVSTRFQILCSVLAYKSPAKHRCYFNLTIDIT